MLDVNNRKSYNIVFFFLYFLRNISSCFVNTLEEPLINVINLPIKRIETYIFLLVNCNVVKRNCGFEMLGKEASVTFANEVEL